jgi:hypothetical protein
MEEKPEPQPVLVPELRAADVVSYAIERPVLSPVQSSIARLSLLLAVMSGLCVISSIGGIFARPIGLEINICVFIVTVGTAVIVGARMFEEGSFSGLQQCMGVAAVIGVALLATTPVLLVGRRDPSGAGVCALIGFLLTATTTARHVMHYRELARWAAKGNVDLAGSLRRLGMTKAIFEGIWLLICLVTVLLIIGVSADLDVDDPGACEIGAVGVHVRCFRLRISQL